MKKKSLFKSWKRRITAGIVGVALSFMAFTGSAVLAAPVIPVDTSGIDNYNGGRLPAGLDSSYYTLPQDTNAITPRGVPLPKQYDLRNEGLVTGTRNQNPWGACWSFGNTSSIESNAVLKGAGSAGSLDYSEHYMAWFTFQPYQGEGYEIVEGAANALDFGGRRQMATADTTAWFGPIDETLAPYVNAAGTLDKNGDWSLSSSLRDGTDEVHVQNVDYLPETGVFTGTAVDKDGNTYKTGYSFDEDALKAVKSALMENGVLDVSYYSARSLPDQEEKPTEIFNMDNHAQYSPRNASANHEVSIVGWNDTYGVENFSTTPPGPGAWIVKNSWGKGNGGPDSVDAEGYFYISYYDQTVSEFTSYQVDVLKNGLFAYDNNYQYDFLGYKSFMSVPPSEASTGNRVANVFTAEKDEVLTAVSAITVDTNSTVEVEIYKLADGADLSGAGEAVSTATAYPTYGGFHTIELNKDVELKAGERFAVVETITGASGGYLPIEMGYSGIIMQGGGGQIKSIAKIEPGQSYVGSEENGQWVWSDMADAPAMPKGEETMNFGNVMIKAFTVDKDDAVTAALTVESLDGQKQSLGSQEVTDFTAPVLLPAGTETIRLSATAQNGTARLSVDENTEIAKADFQNTPIILSLASEPRGNNGAEYPLSFSLQTPAPSGGTDEPQPGSGGTETKYAEAPAQPGVLTGLASTTNIWLPVGIIILVIVIAGVWAYLRRKNK
ncbi:MAG: lectin like domain-containing protein [Eubacterium callanderi]|uniref:lectin like domain-containing protein n=1 Tax=Eubacterium callanderi TaxID=53442 RepID=UPI0026720A82|nr:lectin like domain-containing protein [Eubacterium callanderi]